MSSFNHPNEYHYTHFIDEKTGTEKLSDLFKVIQLASGIIIGIQILAEGLESSCFSTWC